MSHEENVGYVNDLCDDHHDKLDDQTWIKGQQKPSEMIHTIAHKT